MLTDHLGGLVVRARHLRVMESLAHPWSRATCWVGYTGGGVSEYLFKQVMSLCEYSNIQEI